VNRNIFVPLTPPAREALVRLAEQQWRDPKTQAALLLTEALQRHGVLSPEEGVGNLVEHDDAVTQ
jgi:hypothetical protein